MIKDLKELKQLFQLCRKQGVAEITIGDCHVIFGDLPENQDNTQIELKSVDSTELTDEELMFYSVEGSVL